MKAIIRFLLTCLLSLLTYAVSHADIIIRGTSAAPQSIVAGSKDVIFCTLEFDATQSSEDIAISSIPAHLTYTDGNGTDIRNCRIFNGVTILTTGHNVVNPDTAASSASYTFTLDHTLVVPKRTIVTLSIVCDTSYSATWFMGHWDMSTSDVANLNVTGVITAQSVKATGHAIGTVTLITRRTSARQISSWLTIEKSDECGGCDVTVLWFNANVNSDYYIVSTDTLENATWTAITSTYRATASATVKWAVERTAENGNRFFKAVEIPPTFLTVTSGSTQSDYRLVAANTTLVVANELVFHASYDTVILDHLRLKLANPEVSSAGDIIMVHVFDGDTEVGGGVFIGEQTSTQITFSEPVLIQKDTAKTLTVRVDTAPICAACYTTHSGHLLRIEYDDENPEQTTGVRVTMGERVEAKGQTFSRGLMVVKSFPTVELDPLPFTAGLTANVPLLRFKVTADTQGPITIGKLTLKVTTSSVDIGNVNVFAFTDSSYSQPIAGVNSGGQLMTENANPDGAGKTFVYPQTVNGGRTTVQVLPGTTLYFEVRATSVFPVPGATNYNVVTTIMGDGYWSTPVMQSFQDIDQDEFHSNFIWSPNSVTTSWFTNIDWTDGYAVPGLSWDGVHQVRTN